MEKINITGNPDTNVDWYADGERVNAAVLNRPIKQLAGFVNTLIDDHNSVELRPNIKPSLNLDFANGKSVDPRVTFTRPTIATYFDQNGILQIAQPNKPRIDYDPVTGECKGLLIEEQRTNLLPWSQKFDDASWEKYNVTVIPNAVIAPDGTLTGAKIIESATADTIKYVVQYPSSLLDDNSQFTVSVFAKAGERTVLWLESRTKQPTYPQAYFDLANGIVLGTAEGATAKIEPVGNGWYRCSITANTLTGTYGQYIVCGPAIASWLRQYTGDGTSGIYVWGAQFEAGAFPTSYIPTNGTQVTRAADSAVMTDANFSSWFNPNEGTFFADASVAAFSKNSVKEHPLLFVHDGAGVNFFSLRSWSEAGKLNVDATSRSNGVSVADFAGLKYDTSPVLFREALSYDANSFSFSANGSIEVDNNISLPVGLDRMIIGSTNIHIRRIAYWPKRLPNETLQVLTKD